MDKKKHFYSSPSEAGIDVKVIPKILDKTLPNRIGTQTPRYIVIHEVSLGVGKSSKEYDMEHYYQKIENDAKGGSKIGYHYLCGDMKIYQFLEDDVATCHTGTDFGNMNSIGVERLICEGINYDFAIFNQAKLIATLMKKHNIPIENVLTHKEMQIRYGTPDKKENPKECPGRLLAGVCGTLEDFMNEIIYCLKNKIFFEELF